jgi:ribosomal protein S18 acetylase RimI-like enzyme
MDAASRLDNPIWSCLSSRHADFARGGKLARRYHADISPISGLAGDEPMYFAELESLLEIGDDFATFGFSLPSLSASWETLYASRLTQMVRADATPLPERDADVIALGAADVPEMLTLVELTRPGPFRQRTIALGNYLGIREDGRLVAMAGERMWIDNFREVSAICTHPQAQGRGYARTLMSRVINRMLRAGETPFLHVESKNRRAIDVYRALGFTPRAEFALLYAKRIG